MQYQKYQKVKNLETKQAFDTFDTALPNVNQKNYVSKNNDELRESKSEKLHEVLNRFIADSIAFDVSADDFQVIDTNKKLKTSDKEFLEINSAAILCQLQQSLLMKHLFSHSPELLEDFAFELQERESILTETTEITYGSNSLAVIDVTRHWFERLLNG